MNTPLKIGGMRVPKAAHKPKATAIPSDSPRKRMVKPKVRPPMPQRSPKKKAQNKVLAEVAERTANRSLVKRLPKNQGAMIQLKKPPTSQ
jgi:hypothetical protein